MKVSIDLVGQEGLVLSTTAWEPSIAIEQLLVVGFVDLFCTRKKVRGLSVIHHR